MKILLRASVISLALSLVVLASPHMGFDDTPALPMPDGSGDIPEIAIKLVKADVIQAASQPDELKLSSLRGKVVLLDIFASWCPHCQEHAPHIVEFYNQYK